jgi:hypothetical protein
MKKLLILFGTLTLSFGLLYCEKETSVEDELIGTWYMPQTLNRHTAGKSVDDVAGHSLNAWNYSMVVTTNSNQELIDRMADGEGAINVTGVVEDEIKFMYGWFDKNSGEAGVSITNYNWNDFQEHSDKPMISGYMDNFSHQYQDSVNVWYNDSTGTKDTMIGWWSSDFIGVYFNDGNYIEVNDEIDFTFDGKKLDIPNQTFTVNDSVSLSLGGTLTHATINIPANTPTEIFSHRDDTSWDYGSWSIHIEEDGRWVEVYTWEDPYDSSGWTHTYTDSTIAEWELDGDTLLVTYRYDDIWVNAGDGPGIGQGTWLYQVAYTYELNDSELKLTNEFDMCQGETYCKEWLEWEYGLDPGSLEEFKMVWALEFTKTPSARSREFRGPFRTVIGRFPPYSLMK